ncbi:transcriptional regulator [Streptomyces sp. NPDC054933]
MEPNTPLDALLDEASMSHAGLAARVNHAGQAEGKTLRYDHTAVARWLKGQRPRGRVPDLICGILTDRLQRPISLDDIGMGVSGAVQTPGTPLAGFVERATALWRSDQQQRPDVHNAPTVEGTAAIVPVWEWENPPGDLDVSRTGTPRVGQSDVDMLRTARSHYEQMYRHAGGVATRTRIVRFLNAETAPLLRGAYSDATGRQLHRAAGGLVALAGICAYDSNVQGLAQRYFHHALRLAKASEDRAFGGYVIALLVNRANYQRDYRQAVAFAEAALRSAGPYMSPALATDLYAMQAKAYARMGDQNSAHRRMQLAETTARNIRRSEEPAETGYVQPGLVEANFAETLMSLGDLQPARDYAQEAVDVQAHPRGRVHRLATLTNVDLRRGEAERAAATAAEMVQHAQGQESHRLRDRLRSVRQNLTANGGKATSEAAELIDETLRVPL